MSYYHFLFTYSVSPNGDGDKKTRIADRVRRKIAEIEEYGWKKLDNVETTFAGKIYLTAVGTQEKREDAEKIVTDVLRKVIDEDDAYSDVWVSVALIVNGLGQYIDFRI